MEDQEARELIHAVNKTLQEEPKKYTMSRYSIILSLNIVFNRIGITEISIQEIVNLMKKNITLFMEQHFDINDEINIFGYYNYTHDNEEDRKLFSEYMKELRQHYKAIIENAKIENLRSILINKDSWAQDLYEYVSNSDLLTQKTFFSRLDLDILIELINSSSNEKIIKFKNVVVNKVYPFSNIKDYYSADKDSIDAFVSKLNNYYNEIKDTKKIRSIIIKDLIKELKNISSRLS